MYLFRHIALICLSLFAVVAQAEDRGTILSEYWLGIPGNALTGLTTDARYPASPSGVSVLSSFQTPVNTADSYGTRVRGFLYPPVTGAYRFWVAGDDQCELWLSTDDSPATKVLIANTYSWTSPQEWTKYASQQSVEITLQAGSRYYIEALHKEGGGGDSLAVAWAYPGVDRQVISGEFLAPAAPAPVPGSGTGYVLREWWSGLTGTAVADLTAAPAFPASPTARDYLTTFETAANWGDNYGTRVRGFLRPTQSGTYFFWISGDDGCQLWLSQDAQSAQKGLIASVPGHTGTREWTKYPQQKSIAIDLQAGASYYIEALHKEGGGGDIVSVAWSGPGIGDTPTVITGNYLSPSSTENPPTPVGLGSGTILVETWNDIPGNTISALTAHPYFPVRPSARGVLTQFKAPTDSANTYGRRVRGYVCPTITGNYRFWIASDDEGSLRLSTDENPANAVVIASVATWTGAEQWDNYPTQQSALIPLTGGQRYYIEAVQKEGTGGDNLAVAWVGPSLIKGVIPGAFLAPVIAPIIEGTHEFTTSTTVTISATGTSGSLRYTTDGTTPTAASTLYTAPFAVTSSTVVKAVHVTASGVVSEVAEQVFLRQGTGTGLAGSYFANEYLGGQPVLRLDPVLQFVWGTTAPISGIPADHFSARWQGEIETQLNEDYTLILRSDDGVRVWLDGALVINNWTYHGATDYSYVLPSGRHTLAIEYMEGAVQAELQMFWQSAHQARKIVPSTQLYPLEGVQGIIPPTSPVSPAYVEVAHGSGASITATVAGNAFPTNHLDDTIRYFNVPLDPAQPTAIAVSSGAGASLTGDITWVPTNVVGNTETVIRKNDSLLLQFQQAGSLSITNYSGTYLGPITVTAGQRLPVLFSKAGEFTVRLNSQGVEFATLDVTVVTADLANTILCEVGFARAIDVDINPFDAPLTFVGNSQLSVTTEAIAQDLASLRIMPLRRGTPRLLARIHGAHGPLVAEQVIEEFTIDNAALHSAVVNASTGIGTVTLVMRPYIPGEIYTMTMFAHSATFRGGATSITVDSTGGPSSNGEPPMIQKVDAATGESIGLFRFDLEVPEHESKFCFRVLRTQAQNSEQNGAFLPGAASPIGLQANIPKYLAMILGATGTGGQNGPTTNVNGDVCHVVAFASLIFSQAVDSSEDENNESGNPELWSPRSVTLKTLDYCSKGTNGDENCTAVSYKLKISDPPSGADLDDPKEAKFGENKESDCKTCSGGCGPITPDLNVGTIPARYSTTIEVCTSSSSDTLASGGGGTVVLAKLDAHGTGSSSRAKFPDYAETLKRRKGTVFDPVIQIDSGGDESTNGCSLYGWKGSPDCTVKDKWSFSAIARDPNDPTKNIPTELGYSIKWKNVPGHANSSSEKLQNVQFPVGRFFPRLEVWYIDPNPPSGETATPVLVGEAEIHSIVVESSRGSNVGGKNPDIQEDDIRGAAFLLQSNAGGQAVDSRVSIQGGSNSRGRVSLDGYPQNEYWVTSNDGGDLAQVVTIQDGESAKLYLQGYIHQSDSIDDLKLRCEGQALIEDCIGCSVFLTGPVNAEWQDSDTEKFTGVIIEWVKWHDDQEQEIVEQNNHPEVDAAKGIKWNPSAKAYFGDQRDSIEAWAQLSPAVKGVKIYFHQGDPDDPTSQEGGDETGDNRRSFVPRLESWISESITGTLGRGMLPVTTSMAPGDNSRIFAALHRGGLNKAAAAPSQLEPDSYFERFGVKSSELLTIWRTLSVEIDSMISEFATPRQAPDVVTAQILSYSILNPGAENEYKIAFTVSGFYGVTENRYEKGHFFLNNSDYEIKGSRQDVNFHDVIDIFIPVADAAMLPGLIGVTVIYTDDDSLSPQLPQFPAIGEKVKRAYRFAYIDIENLLPIYNPNRFVPFASNYDSSFDDAWDVEKSEKYWTALVVMCYQGGPGEDNDPNAENNLLGITPLALVSPRSAIFVEDIRDEWPDFRDEGIQHTIAHEVAHHTKLLHTDEGIMKVEATLNDWEFDLSTILEMRDTIKW